PHRPTRQAAGLATPPRETRVVERAKAPRAIFPGVGHWTDGQGRFTAIVPPGPGIVTAATDDRYKYDADYMQAAIRKEDEGREYKDQDVGFGGAFTRAPPETLPLPPPNPPPIPHPPPPPP